MAVLEVTSVDDIVETFADVKVNNFRAEDVACIMETHLDSITQLNMIFIGNVLQ